MVPSASGHKFFIVGFSVLALCSAVLAEAPSTQPAAGFTPAQQKALDEILKNLETLRADEKSLPAIQAYLDHQKQDLATQLQQADSQVKQLQTQLQAVTAQRNQLAARLQSIQVGKALLATGTPPATTPPLAVPPPPLAQPAVAAASGKPAKPEVAFFVEQVRPVLASQCLNCHGGQFKKGGLDLSTRDSLVKGGDTGAAIVPGKAQESLLYKLITHAQDPHMPAKAPKLPDDTIAKIAKWIDSGALYDAPLKAGKQAAAPGSQPAAAQASRHWSFKPVVRSPEPAVKAREWFRNPVDSFVLARLESAGLKPSPEADRPVLIRRLSFDLLGLLPKASDIEDFVRDTRPDAYERLVDRLLASPHFGERWGRHWLDLARYADSDGYEKDSARPNAWRWRDWVIDAINRDMPFDQFTTEQLAGDLLPNATLEQRVATGFHRNTLTNKEGGVDQEEFRVKAVVDRLNTTGSVWLGLTVGCAQCHTHKYDPISNREYYELFAFFNGSKEVDVPAPLPADVEAYHKAKALFDAEHAKLQATLTAYDKDHADKHQADWEKEAIAEPEWTLLKPVFASSAAGATFKAQKDGSVLAGGKNPATDSYTFVCRTDLTGITALKIEALADPSLPSNGPGRVAHGNFVLTKVTMTATDLADPSNPASAYRVPFTRAIADHFQPDGPYRPEDTLEGKPGTGWAILPQVGKNHAIVLETAQDVGRPGGTLLGIVLDQNFGDMHTIGRVRISVTTAKRPVRLETIPDNIRKILQTASDKRKPEQKAKLREYWLNIDPERAKLDKAVEAHLAKAPPVPMAQMLAENAKPPVTHILAKGDFLRPGDEVQPATLAVLHPFKSRGQQPDRLDLARWLVDPANPLTARVTVNRMWQHLFGQGLVTALDDFGTRSDPPSHPELLDWLASEFIQRGWSQKAMIKLIVTSATYRQSSHVSPELLERDPKNVLLARQTRFRVEAEIVRDITLQAGGILNEAIGGPSIRPPLPRDLAALVYASTMQWDESPGPLQNRRGMYVHFQRTIPYPMLMAFDEPDSNVTCSRRERSNTPLQSLTLLNDAEFFRCAQTLGLQALHFGPPAAQATKEDTDAGTRLAADEPAGNTRTPKGKPAGSALEHGIRLIYRVCLARDPDAMELARLGQLWQEIGALSAKDAQTALKMIGKPKTQLAAAELPQAAAWIAVARTVMNLDEFVTRE